MRYVINKQLTLHGITTREEIEPVFQAIHQHEQVPMKILQGHFRSTDQPSPLHIHEADYSGLHDDLQAAIENSGLAYALHWQSLEYSTSGVIFYDPRTGTTSHQPTIKAVIAVTADLLHNPDAIEQARADHAVLQQVESTGLHVAETSHHLIELLSEHPDLKAFRKRTQ